MAEPQDSGGRGDGDTAAGEDGGTTRTGASGSAETESPDGSRSTMSGQDAEGNDGKSSGSAAASEEPVPAPPAPDEPAAGPRATSTYVTGAAVSAAGFGLDGPRGPVFRDVTFELPAGGLGAVEGQSGSGRTCLLLALTGRMKAREGHAQVGRNRLPKQIAAVRRISALGPVAGVTDLEPSLTVAEHLRERVLLQQRFGDSLRALIRPRRERAAARKALLDTALNAAGLDLESLPKGQRTYVRDLERLEALRLSVALAMLSGPRLLAVDDLDLKLSEQEREQAWSLLRSITEAGTTVLAVCSHAPEDAVVIRTGADSRHSSGTGDEAWNAGRTGVAGKALRALRPGKPSGAKPRTQDRRTGNSAAQSAGEPGGTDGEDTEGDDTAAGETGGRKTKGEAADALAEARRA